MSTNIRRLHAADIPELCRLDYGWRASDFQFYLAGSKWNSNALVATDSGRVVGHVCYEFTRATFMVSRLFVAPMARRRGHGRALIGELRGLLRDERQTRIVVPTGEHDGDLRRFLLRMGFVRRVIGPHGELFMCGLVPEQWRPRNRISQYVEGC